MTQRLANDGFIEVQCPSCKQWHADWFPHQCQIDKLVSAMEPIAIPLTRGKTAIVDPVDADLVAQKWFACGREPYTYAMRNAKNGKQERMHRIILEREIGRELLPGEMADHIDGNVLNNRRDNLRVVSNAQNIRNRKRNSNNTSGYKGVSLNKQTGHWTARIGVEGKYINLGVFATPEQAALIYDAAARHYHGEFANLNFPRWLMHPEVVTS